MEIFSKIPKELKFELLDEVFCEILNLAEIIQKHRGVISESFINELNSLSPLTQSKLNLIEQEYKKNFPTFHDLKEIDEKTFKELSQSKKI